MRSSLIIAVILSLALAGWIASPYILSAADGQTENQLPTHTETKSSKPLFTVRTRHSIAEEIARTVVSHGKTAPARKVDLRAEVEGSVLGVPGERGSVVKAGDLIVKLDPREKQQMLNQSKAALDQSQIEYQAAQKLGQKGFQSETTVARSLAELELALAMVQQETIRIAQTQIRAPFSGVLEDRPVEIGDFLKVGELAATILEMDPLIVEADLPETFGTAIYKGMPARATLITGETVEGRIRYVSREASESTRTFQVELEIDNPDNLLPAGVSATLEIELATLKAHEVSSALLALDDSGRIGVKILGEDDIVQFVEASIVKSGPNSVWLADLDDEVRLITVGQGFVRTGQKVDPRPEEAVEPNAAIALKDIGDAS